LIIAGLLLYVPVNAHAEWSLKNIKEWIGQLLQWRLPSAEEWALAPQVMSLPPIPDLLRGLRSRSLNKRLASLDALTRSRDTSPRVLAALVRVTQDNHPQVAERASLALSNLCRWGHTDEVIQAFAQELGIRPEPRLLQSDYHFKILDAAEEARAQTTFARRE
jgi:hypothetical protein